MLDDWNIDEALEKFKKLMEKDYVKEELSESDTRSKFIDYILIECLGWSESNIVREERCLENGSYLDYKLCTNIPIIIIEAKKNKISFELPKASKQSEYKIGGVLSDSKILLQTMIQARDYAISKGITFCVITNGEEFVFFRSQNQQGIEWVEHKAIIFRNLIEIRDNFDLFCRLLSMNSASEGLLHQTIPISKDSDSGITKYMTLDTRHIRRPRNIDRNPLFTIIGTVIHRVFQDLASKEAESEILEHCYVESPRKKVKEAPFLDRQSKTLIVSKKDAGDFQRRIIATLKAGDIQDTEVILLIGSVGVGKSTFIQRFRKVLVKKEIDEKGIWIYINFMHFSDTGEKLDTFIYNQIDKIISTEYSHLGLDEWRFLKQVYHSEYEKSRRGALAPLFLKDPNEFEQKMGEKIDEWINTKREEHFTKLLSTASKRLSKNIFLVFDNADQLKPETQNEIFLVSQKLAETINCYVLLALREESYWKNRNAGPLNAFHTTAYNIQPASLKQVISKRFQYAKSLINDEKIQLYLDYQISNEEILAVFDRLVQTLLGKNEDYIEFIESTSVGDTRRALDNIAAFMISGHTNFEAILRDERKESPTGFPIPFHEFINAIILRDNEVYSETNCDIINIFNVNGSSDSSNFNRIAVLGRILKANNSMSIKGIGYVSIEEVVNDCHSVGILPETTLSILNILNTHRLIETETTIKEKVDSTEYVRITVSGKYYVEKLTNLFGYLSLIIYETPICDDISFGKLKKKYGELNSITSNLPKDRYDRVVKRLELVEIFIHYLYSEFTKSSFRKKPELFSSSSINVMNNLREHFEKEKVIVIENAKKVFIDFNI